MSYFDTTVFNRIAQQQKETNDLLRELIKTLQEQKSNPTQTPMRVQQPEGDLVAYMDAGGNGYLDLMSELSEGALQQLPKGLPKGCTPRVTAGTHGVNGYVATPQPAPKAQAAESVTEPAGVEEGDIDAVALARYKVVPAHESMIHRFAVVAGDGNQQLYLGREVECENMARKFAGAFLDGAFYQSQIAAAPTPAAQAADSVPAVEREQERIAFKDAHRHLELYEVPDAWGRPMFKHSHVEASWLGWIARTSHGQAPASVLHLVHSAFAEIAMAFPKAFALHKVGIADTAVREALAAPAPAAESVQQVSS